MKVAAVIVAGGQSSRMGREKAFETVRGRTIIERIISSVQGKVAEIAVNASGDPTRFAQTGLKVFPDVRNSGTPLAGLHAALHFADVRGFDAVLTLPSDTPFLPDDLLSRLQAALQPAAIAASGGQRHYLTGLWRSELFPRVEKALAITRVSRLQDWAAECSAASVEWSVETYDPFFNVNSPEDLAEAERIAAEFSL